MSYRPISINLKWNFTWIYALLNFTCCGFLDCVTFSSSKYFITLMHGYPLSLNPSENENPKKTMKDMP